jgi:DNA-nicking Smr family endonuclease
MNDDGDDFDLFRRELDNVKPLNGNRVEPARRRLKPIPGQRIADDARVIGELAEASPFDSDVEIGDELLFVRNGVQQKLLRKLRRGQFSIGAALDLHGMTVAEAREALAEFLQDCRRRGIRGVRIIHGKGLRSPGGRPVIKGKLDSWLRHRDEVVAYCSARQIDGGTGAVYVLLKR